MKRLITLLLLSAFIISGCCAFHHRDRGAGCNKPCAQDCPCPKKQAAPCESAPCDKMK